MNEINILNAMSKTFPKVINDFIKSDQKPNKKSSDYLLFTDWIDKNEHLATDWTIVARIDTSNNEDMYTTSCFFSLASGTDNSIVFEQPEWEINFSFGLPVLEGDLMDQWSYSEQVEEKLGDVILKPFIIRRDFGGYVPGSFEIIQHFLLYYNAFWNPEKNEYQSIQKNGEIASIVKIEKNNSVEKILVNTFFLRNYLALTHSSLLRFHSHIRKSEEILKSDIPQKIIKNNALFYSISAKNDDLYYRGSISRLLGKDIVHGFSKPIKQINSEENKFVNFIYDVDNDGNLLEETCDSNLLTNNFSDRGTQHFLTPIFFKKDVLLKYYGEPSRFTLDNGYLQCLNLWGIPFDITDASIVQVWLGDLSRIPYNEQLHWRQFNISPIGTISSGRFQSDFMAEWVSPTIEERPVYHLKDIYQQINNITQRLYGGNIFLELHSDDKYHIKTLRIPLNNEDSEFDSQISSLAKIFCDSLNVTLLKQVFGEEANQEETKGSIQLLRIALNKLGITDDQIEVIIQPFGMIQTIRSTGIAHRKGEKFNGKLKQYNLNNLSNEDRIKQIIISLCYSLYSLNKHLAEV